ncbi:MAG: DUF937 domain-containing protein [Lysobacteraceae bacterium]
MADLADTLLSSLDARSVQSMSRQLGLDPQQTAGAIQAALPMLLGQMAKNASQPDGANALLGAVQRDHTGIDIDGLLGGLLGSLGGGQAQPARNSGLAGGMAILGHVFGGGQGSGAAQVPKVQGLDSAGSTRLLAMLAPMVMAALGKMTQGGQLNAGALSGLLGGESQRIAQAPPSALDGMLGAVLDSDGDGKMDIGGVLKSAQTLGGLFGKR